MKTYSISQAAKILQVSSSTLRRWERNNDIPVILKANFYQRRYNIEDILEIAKKKGISKLNSNHF